jgi:hypothetical protein
MSHDRDDDYEYRVEAAQQRRDMNNGCKCGNPEMPGQCPGWRNCPMHGEEQESKHE